MKPIFTFLLLFVAFCGFSQPTMLEHLETDIQKAVEEENLVGLTVVITTSDSVILNRSFGFSNKENQQQTTENTLFRAGSIAKMFISMSIIQLVEQGKLSLDDEVAKIAPEIKFQNKWESETPLKVIHLLEHTSGFDDIKLNRFLTYNNDVKHGFQEVKSQFPSMICRWRPGERMSYSNPNYTALGFIIEKISGQSYHKYIEENIFKPLEMTTSNFNLKCGNSDLETKEYVFEKGQIKEVVSANCVSGASGSLWSSSRELLNFIQVFLQNDSSIISPKSIQEIETTHSTLAAKNDQTIGYGLGNSIAFLDKKVSFRGHDGLMNACFSSLYYNRDLGVGFVVLNNSNKPNWRINDLIVNYLTANIKSEIFKNKPVAKSKIQPFLGQYQFESPRVQLSAFADRLQNTPTIFLKNDELYFKPLFGEASKLIQVGEMQFTWENMNVPFVTFTQSADGKNVMMIGGEYYEQSSAIWVKFRLAVFAISIVLLLSSLFLFITNIFQRIFKKITWKQLIIRSLPFLGFVSLVLGALSLNAIQEFTYKMAELDHISTRSLTIFLGTLGFGIASILTLFFAIKDFKNNSKFFKFYFLLLTLAMTFLTIFLMINGWIGMRTWAM